MTIPGPPWIGTLAVILGIMAGAVALHWLLASGVDKLLAGRQTLLASLFQRTKGLIRLGLIVLVISASLPFLDLGVRLEAGVDRVLMLALLFLVGWTLLIVCDIAAELYLRPFRIDVEDNLAARKVVTQVRILKRTAKAVVVLLIVALMLMTFETARQYGVSLMASAGAAGLILGLAARPVLSNLIAGVQIAITQPIRVDDAVVVEGEWGWIEEIGGAFVVIKLWDWRRLVVPLTYFIEKPFQNWTRTTASIIGTVYLHVDYTVPVEVVRRELEDLAKASPLWDGQVVNLQVTESLHDTMQLRALVSASTSPKAWDLRCEIREKLIGFLQQEYPGGLPKQRPTIETKSEAANFTRENSA